MPLLVGWDMAPTSNGWCAGDGASVPEAGAFQLEDVGDRFGDRGAELSTRIMQVHRQFPATHWCAEKPLLLPTDKLDMLINIYGGFFLLATLAAKLGIHFEPVDNQQAKLEFAGRKATKDDTARIAERIGVSLPLTIAAGRWDAADAVAVWKVGIRLFAKEHLARWDAAIYSRRGALL